MAAGAAVAHAHANTHKQAGGDEAWPADIELHARQGCEPGPQPRCEQQAADEEPTGAVRAQTLTVSQRLPRRADDASDTCDATTAQEFGALWGVKADQLMLVDDVDS